MIDIEEVLKDLMARFNKKTTEDERLRSELKNITRKIMIEMTDGESYNFLLENNQIINLSKGEIVSPDIKIISDTKTFEGLINRKIGPMKAIATGKLKIIASLEDKLRLRKLF